MTTQERISEALETLLSEIYEENNIKTGDIHPLDSMRWDMLTAEMTILFSKLIQFNKPR